MVRRRKEAQARTRNAKRANDFPCSELDDEENNRDGRATPSSHGDHTSDEEPADLTAYQFDVEAS